MPRLSAVGISGLQAGQDVNKHVVEYRLAYDHIVRVGIEAPDPQAAMKKARAFFDEGTLWDNTPRLPLLYDDFEEQESNALEFRVLESGKAAYPAPDVSVVIARKKIVALQAAERLVEVYRQGKENGGGIEWSDLDEIHESLVDVGFGKTRSEGDCHFVDEEPLIRVSPPGGRGQDEDAPAGETEEATAGFLRRSSPGPGMGS